VDQLEALVCRVRRVHRDQQVLLVVLVQPVQLDLLDLPVQLVLWVSPVLQEDLE